MYLLLNDHNVILVISDMCDKVPMGWRISKNSIYKSSTATRVEVDEVPPEVVPKRYKYQDGAFCMVEEVVEPVDTTKQIEENIKSLEGDINNIKDVIYDTDPNDMSMEDFRAYLREYNNSLLEKFLKDNPLKWTNGKSYSATNDDQTLMLKNYNGWKMLSEAGADVKLEWNAANESCSELSEEEYLQLMGAIYMYAKKMLKLCQWYKLKIINAVTRVELNELKLEYSIELADELLEKLREEG